LALESITPIAAVQHHNRQHIDIAHSVRRELSGKTRCGRRGTKLRRF
jgi:hypothetical protein